MKNLTKRALTLITLIAMLMTSTISVAADDFEEKKGTGNYTVVIRNGDDTGVSIDDDIFHAYQIFIADDVTSYSVTEAFRGFFIGDDKTSGDGSAETYNFNQYLTIIDAYEDVYKDDQGVVNTTVSTGAPALTADDIKNYETALDNYNQLAGQYMDSYSNNMYALAIQMRTYLDTYGAHNDGSIECYAHAQAVGETATLNNLETGYYFIFDQESSLDGIGISASGAFIPLTTASDSITYVDVKQSIPTMTKTIFHDDTDKWDIVGDSQIGDTVAFRVISTLPTNIDDYIKTDDNNAINEYTYVLTDTMSAGLTYNYDVAVYTDEGFAEVSADDYYEVEETDSGFVLTFDAIKFLEANPNSMTLYTYYSATLNKDAAVASEYDKNTALLEYSNNPELDTTATTDSTVFHHTFALDVNKVDESGEGLAGAHFNLKDGEGAVIPLTKGDTDYNTGVVSYYYDINAISPAAGEGYIVTETVTLEGASSETVTGKFTIYGLNDQTTYTLQEVAAPNGYNTADQFDFIFTVTYDALGTTITHFTDGSAYVNTSLDNATEDWSSSSTIINRLKIYLPETGGVGTVMFQVGGGALMLGAALMLIINTKKKNAK